MSDNCQQPKSVQKQKITCDQVAWLSDVMDRFTASVVGPVPSVSRRSASAKLAAILEIMELLGCEFADDEAAGNAISQFPELNILRKLET